MEKIQLIHPWGYDQAMLEANHPVVFNIHQNDFSIVSFSLNQPDSMRRVARLLLLAADAQETIHG